jgi:hypothetical protein
MGIGKLSTNGRWAVNGTPIYIPASDTQVSHESIQSADTGRTEDGVMHIDWVRKNMVKVFLSWRYLTGNEVATLERLMQGKEFTLTYFDKGSKHTADVYVSNMNYKKITDSLYTDEGGLYGDITANAIEI